MRISDWSSDVCSSDLKLVKQFRSDDLSFVHVPDERDEAFRDLVRAWGGAKSDLRQAKQRLKSFLLVHGVRYTGNADWRDAHRRWLSEFTFPEPCSQDRKSVGSGQSWSVRVDLGGRRIIKKKK